MSETEGTTPEPSKAPGGRLTLWFAIGLFVFAFGLRLVGIGWGLKNDLHNQPYHPDELTVFGASQAVEPAKLKFTPGFYNYGTFYPTVLRVATDVVTAYGGSPKEGDAASTWEWVSRSILAGRVINALAGAGTVVVVFLVLRRYAHLFGAVFGALIMAVAPAFVVHSRFGTVDVMATFLLSLGLYFAIRLVPAGDEQLADKSVTKFALFAGLFVGLSAGTKYSGIVALLAVWAALAITRPKGWWWKAIAATAVAGLAFVVSTPGIFLDSEKFWRDFNFERQHVATGHGLVFVHTVNGYIYHWFSLLEGIGTLGTILGVAGLIYACVKKQRWAYVAAAFFLAVYLVIGNAEVKFIRYAFPLFVPVAMGFGYLIGETHRRQGTGRLVAALGIVAVGGIDMGGMIGAARMTSWMVGEDPRDSAARYLREKGQGHPESTIGFASEPWFYSPPLFPDAPQNPQLVPPEARREQIASATEPRIVLHVPEEPGVAPFQFDSRLITVDRPERIVMSSYEFGDPRRLMNDTGLSGADATIVGRYRDFSAALDKDYVIEKAWALDTTPTHDLQYAYPTVIIWKRKDLP